MAQFKFKGKLVEGRDRCEVQGSKILPCYPLEHVLGWFGGSARTRLTIGLRVHLKTDAERDALELRHGAKGFELNVCPFCGATVRTAFDIAVMDGALWLG